MRHTALMYALQSFLMKMSCDWSIEWRLTGPSATDFLGPNLQFEHWSQQRGTFTACKSSEYWSVTVNTNLEFDLAAVLGPISAEWVEFVFRFAADVNPKRCVTISPTSSTSSVLIDNGGRGARRTEAVFPMRVTRDTVWTGDNWLRRCSLSVATCYGINQIISNQIEFISSKPKYKITQTKTIQLVIYGVRKVLKTLIPSPKNR